MLKFASKFFKRGLKKSPIRKTTLNLNSLESREVLATWNYFGNGGNWSDANNWIGGLVPAGGADIRIPNGTGPVIVDQAVDVGKLEIDAKNGGWSPYVWVNNDLNVHDGIEADQAVFAMQDDVNLLGGTSHLNSSRFTSALGNPNLNIASEAGLELLNQEVVNFNGVGVINSGTVTLNGASSMTNVTNISQQRDFVNNGYINVNNAANSYIQDFAALYNSGTIQMCSSTSNTYLSFQGYQTVNTGYMYLTDKSRIYFDARGTAVDYALASTFGYITMTGTSGVYAYGQGISSNNDSWLLLDAGSKTIDGRLDATGSVFSVGGSDPELILVDMGTYQKNLNYCTLQIALDLDTGNITLFSALGAFNITGGQVDVAVENAGLATPDTWYTFLSCPVDAGVNGDFSTYSMDHKKPNNKSLQVGYLPE